jgi:hypothetical protein
MTDLSKLCPICKNELLYARCENQADNCSFGLFNTSEGNYLNFKPLKQTKQLDSYPNLNITLYVEIALRTRADGLIFTHYWIIEIYASHAVLYNMISESFAESNINIASDSFSPEELHLIGDAVNNTYDKFLRLQAFT